MVVITKQIELHELLKRGIKKANELNQHVLVSQVMSMTSVDPLSFFYNGRTVCQGNRFYWSDLEGMEMAGVGSAIDLKGYQSRRFHTIEKEWLGYLEHAILDVEYEKGTGPLLIGGATFDPDKRKGEVWGNFPDAGFVVPQFLLTKNNSGTWLTVNILVKGNELSGEATNSLTQKLEYLLETSFTIDEVIANELSIKEISPKDWLDAVSRMAEEIQAGKMDKVVLARELKIEAKHPFSPTIILNRLQAQQKDSFVFAIEKDDTCFIGATPERLIKKEHQTLYTTCLAGTVGRGNTEEEERQLGQFLLNDQKNLTEHQLVVDMITSAMTRVCQHIDVADHPTLYKVGNIQHLYTPIIGHASETTSLFSVVQELHPTPALGGSPRKYAMEKIRELEPRDRGWYASPIGWIDYKGDGELAVAIRSGVIKDSQATLYAGCGIVGDSNPETEYEETKMKFRPMISALGGRLV